MFSTFALVGTCWPEVGKVFEVRVGGIAKDTWRNFDYPRTVNFQVGAKLTYIGTQSQTSLGSDTHTIALALTVLW